MKVIRKLLILSVCLLLSTFVFAQSKSAYTDKNLVWKDDFTGSSLNMNDWNFEFHEPGWVNNELQSYDDSPENTYVKDGNLIIQALKKTSANGRITYTSGRINTQRKHDFKYGRFEARLKVPAGKGFLPAFWMMPTEENLYGQWPKCGEIDIMEVLGDALTKTYGTVHYGEPHAQQQGTYSLPKGNFADEFHIYAVEWEPGEMRFYLDGEMYYKTSEWFTKRNGFGEVTYPAPFDQPFYMILNLAVGGNWPGNPTRATKFEDNAQLVVDYVKVYQKKSYNENVTKPVEVIESRKASADGNLVINPSFTEKESLTDDSGWKFLLAGKGKGTAEIADGALNILTTNCGELDYSVQVVQPNIPLEKGCSYRYSFDAWSDGERTILPAITAPTAGWIRYFPDTKTTITKQRKTYSFDFDMKAKDDPKARVEFNLGNQGSTASVHITNVSVVMTRAKENTVELKAVLPDGNYIYNGEFQEGKDRLASWKVTNNNKDASVTVTNKDNKRELLVSAPKKVSKISDISISQGDLVLNSGVDYLVSLDAWGDSAKTITALIGGEKIEFNISKERKTYKKMFTVSSKAKTQTLELLLGNAGTTYIDNVRIQEDGLLINGNFTSDMTGYEVYIHEAAKADFAVDNLKEKGAFCMNIQNTGNQDWQIQLKQNNITLEKGKWYNISFDAKCSMDRTIMYALQRDGSSDNNWIPYSGTQRINVANSFKNYSVKFQMNGATDKAVILSISMGAVNNKQISTPHTVTIDNIKLIEVTK